MKIPIEKETVLFPNLIPPENQIKGKQKGEFEDVKLSLDLLNYFQQSHAYFIFTLWPLTF